MELILISKICSFLLENKFRKIYECKLKYFLLSLNHENIIMISNINRIRITLFNYA